MLPVFVGSIHKRLMYAPRAVPSAPTSPFGKSQTLKSKGRQPARYAIGTDPCYLSTCGVAGPGFNFLLSSLMVLV